MDQYSHTLCHLEPHGIQHLQNNRLAFDSIFADCNNFVRNQNWEADYVLSSCRRPFVTKSLMQFHKTAMKFLSLDEEVLISRKIWLRCSPVPLRDNVYNFFIGGSFYERLASHKLLFTDLLITIADRNLKYVALAIFLHTWMTSVFLRQLNLS